MGLFDVPTLRRSPDGILALVLGIVLGPLGILITGLVAKHKGTTNLGIIMLVAAIVLYIIGFMVHVALLGAIVYLWALVWGILIFAKST